MKYKSLPNKLKVWKKTLAMLVFVILSIYLLADDWQTGPGGKPSRHGLSTEIGPQAADLLWQGSVSAVVAQQAVIDGDIVVMSRMFNINNVLYGTKIVAHNLITGDTLWTKGLPVDFPIYRLAKQGFCI